MTEEKNEKKNFNKLWLSIILGTVLLIGVSYAWLTLTLQGTKTNVLKSGDLSLILNDEAATGINLDVAVPITDSEGLEKDPYTFTLKNNGSYATNYTIYLDDVELLTGESRLDDQYIKYNLVKDNISLATELLSTTGSDPYRVLDTGVIASGDTYSYDLRLWVDYDATIEASGKVFRGKIRVVADQVVEQLPNKNILAAYTYEPTNTETLCIIGEESTCQKIKPTTYDQGTIVHYQVNDSESHYFYVLHDDGYTLTMQQREDTTTSKWYSSEDNTKGPTTAIAALETETSDWDNVNDQTYTMGTTAFYSNKYTGCSAYNSCTTNTYTWTSRTRKARMITLREAASTGCINSDQYCPIWMYNYLYNSTNYGGTVNGTVNNYWTMTAQSSSAYYAWLVSYIGGVYFNNVTSTYGVRAVVVVDKY